MHGRVVRQDLRKWLSKGRIQAPGAPEEMLTRVLRVIGQPVPTEGLAALRFWGQTGERSGAWIAAADPVHLEPRLDHLCLYALRGDEISKTDLRDIFDYLQQTLGNDECFAFARLGSRGYLRGKEAMATALASTTVVDGQPPDAFMPAGPDAATHDQLLSELQMALHDHQANLNRASRGERTINSLWFWGGGIAPEKEARAIPPLFADDPLFWGYWKSCTGVVETWNGQFEQCLDIAPDGFVAVAPDELDASPPEVLAELLENARAILGRGDLRKLTLLFRDGLKVETKKYDDYKFGRRVSPLLTENSNDD